MLKQKFYDMEERLTSKKEYLFNNQNSFQFWEIPSETLSNKELFLKNKNLAFKYMLPKETLELLQTKEFYGYSLNKLKEEFLTIMERQNKEMELDLSAFSKMKYNLVLNVLLIR